MQAFEYAYPTTLKDALALLGPRWGETEILAGGTDLLALMKNNVATPTRVVSLRGVKDLSGIRSVNKKSGEEISIGALVTLQELLEDRMISTRFPALAQAAAGVASPQIRNMGTVGGDLCQRPRCWYFRNGWGLLARDAKGRPLVPEGDNRYHAIFGSNGAAYFVHPSSVAPALIALGAKVRIAGAKGERDVAAADFFVAPRNEGERENVLQPNEILAAALLPASSAGLRNATYEVRQKEALDWPLATASVALSIEGGKVSAARIVMGHVAPVPWRAADAEKWLAGKTLNHESAAKAGEEAVRGAQPLSRNRYKVQLARVAVKRALLAAAKGGA